ncbi:DUF998 domain-containing protein [Rufibacter quisquiliarum]|uniref:Putative membrane protein n=1 Tax=Rufibacter quisquiliarum TaxID=1549639 RepID=A0A839GC54_9BACT|nr:DUF998 domain-containing protein [Rufibacter quisquiliarum]MBA9075910.1 putative membrane protein [Rufibacter quisquiliarum]
MTQRQAALPGLVAPILFWVTYLALAALRPEYSLLTKAVSELGSVDAPRKVLWNVLGYVLPGLLIVLFSWGLSRHMATAKKSKLPAYSLLLSGLFMALAGIFPGDFENRQTLTMLLHTIGSFGSYIFFLMAAFSFPAVMRTSIYWKDAIKPTLLFTWLTILFGAWPFVFQDFPAVGQRLVFFFYFAWVYYVALKFYKQPQK